MLAVASALALASSGACTSDDDAGPSPTTRPTVPTTVVDRSGIALAAVAGSTTSTIVDTGSAVLSGSVRGPAGLVPGATVRIERLVAGQQVRTDVLTGPDGRFSLSGVPGGRYRLRAFLAPWYAQAEPVVRFLEDGEEHTFDLTVETQTGLVVRADVAPDAPQVDGAVNLVAVVTNRAVGADGVVRSVPVVGTSVELVGLGRWVLRDDSAPNRSTTTSTATRAGSAATTTTVNRSLSPTAVTDGSGQVRFELLCRSAGPSGLALRVPFTVTPPPGEAAGPAQVDVQTITLTLPECTDPGAAPAPGASSSTDAPTSEPTTTTEP